MIKPLVGTTLADVMTWTLAHNFYERGNHPDASKILNYMEHRSSAGYWAMTLNWAQRGSFYQYVFSPGSLLCSLWQYYEA